MSLARRPVRPATVFRSEPWVVVDRLGKPKSGSRDFLVSKMHFRVPLDHGDPDGEKLHLVARIVFAETKSVEAGQVSASRLDWDERICNDKALRERPIMVYLCGGPGADNPPCRVRDMNRWLLRKGFQILYPEYRGCGESDPVTHATLVGMKTDREKADYIKFFCQDSVVRDLEAIRLCLAERLCAAAGKRGCGAGDSLSWTLLGQSFGGQIALTYLSLYPEKLRDVFLTAALPPCGESIDFVFGILFQKVAKRSQEFYAQYPEDVSIVRDILRLISKIGPHNIRMRGRGYLTAQRVLCLGRELGAKTGFKTVHHLLHQIRNDLSASGKLSSTTRDLFEEILRVDDRPLFPLLLEQSWCSGGLTNWSAERVGRQLPGFQALRSNQHNHYLDPATIPPDQPIYFTGDAFCRFHFDTHDGLLDLRGVALLLAAHDWEPRYDYERLRQNQVPVYAIGFTKDMHMDIGLSKRTAAKIGNLHFFEDTENWHQALRNKPKAILSQLFRMKAEADAATKRRA